MASYKSTTRFAQSPPRSERRDTIESSIEEMEKPEEYDIPYEYRMRHVFVPGMTGAGKSTTLQASIMSDILNGAGVCVIDPKGDLVKKIAALIPPERMDDCVYLTLDDPIPIDFMGHSNRDEKETLISNLKYIVTKGASVNDAPLLNDITENVIYTLLSANENPRLPPDRRATFLDIHDFLENDDRREFLMPFALPKYQALWRPEIFPGPKERRPVISRIRTFANTESLSAIVGHPDPELDIAYCVNNRKIILVDLPGGGDSKMVYGSLLIAKIQQAAFARYVTVKSEPDRVPFYLYVDEFEKFQTSSFHLIISQGRGCRLGLTVGCQWIEQLTSDNQRALTTVANYIMFGMSPSDANTFKALINPYKPDVLVTMPPYHAMYVINRANPHIRPTPRPQPDPTEEQLACAASIRERTKLKYGREIDRNHHNSGDGKPDPKRTSPPTNQGQTRDPRNPRRDVRPTQQRRGSHFKEPGSDRK